MLSIEKKTEIADKIKTEVGTTLLKVTLYSCRKIAHHVNRKLNEEITLFTVYLKCTWPKDAHFVQHDAAKNKSDFRTYF